MIIYMVQLLLIINLYATWKCIFYIKNSNWSYGLNGGAVQGDLQTLTANESLFCQDWLKDLGIQDWPDPSRLNWRAVTDNRLH